MSQAKDILVYMKLYKTITALEALLKFNCMRLASRIFDLNKQGANIKVRMITKNKKKFAQYYLD